MKNVSTWWESHFMANETYRRVSFKTLREGGYSHHNITCTRVDEVDLDTFLKIEDERLPLLFGTQFGIFPRLNKISGFFLETRIVALLSKSVLSGNVASLSICLISGSSNTWKVIRDFPNKKEYTVSSIAKEIDPSKDFCCVIESGEKLTVE